jgi:hypothetical protein
MMKVLKKIEGIVVFLSSNIGSFKFIQLMKQTFFFLTFFLISGVVFINSSCNPESNVDCSKYNSTYNSNMKAIIDNKCVSCHSVDGSAESNGIYTTYSSMKSVVSQTWEEINAGRMPKVGSTQLTDAEKEAWECWKNAGYPEK